MKIELNIFTNCSQHAPKTDIIEKTYLSFVKTFGYHDYKIWLDKHPEGDRLFEYENNLNFKFGGPINITESLSDGYIQAIQQSDADYLFMLEHDWIFNDNIRHGLTAFTQSMRCQNLYHLRFNKRKNEPIKWDNTLTEFGLGANLRLCKTPVLSNNPHIIDRKKYLDFIELEYIVTMPGSKGLEEIISKQTHLNGAIYGPLGYPATVTHLDGRK